jgi:hypothetical protein
VTQRKGEADAILQSAAIRRAALRQCWESLRQTYDPAAPFDPAGAELVTPIRERIAGIGARVNQDLLFEPERDMRELTEAAVPRLGAAIRQWHRGDVIAALDELAGWKTPGALSTEAGTLKNKVAAAADLAQTNSVATEVGRWIDEEADRLVASEMIAFEAPLRNANLGQLSDEWMRTARELARRPPRRSTRPDLAAMLTDVGAHRAQLAATLSQSSDVGVINALLSRNLTAALAGLAQVPGGLAIPAVAAAACPFQGRRRSKWVSAAHRASADRGIRDRRPRVIPVNSDTTLQLVSPSLPPGSPVVWTGATAVPGNQFQAIVRPTALGFVEVSCDVQDGSGSVLATARTVLLVGAQAAASRSPSAWPCPASSRW